MYPLGIPVNTTSTWKSVRVELHFAPEAVMNIQEVSLFFLLALWRQFGEEFLRESDIFRFQMYGVSRQQDPHHFCIYWANTPPSITRQMVLLHLTLAHNRISALHWIPLKAQSTFLSWICRKIMCSNYVDPVVFKYLNFAYSLLGSFFFKVLAFLFSIFLMTHFFLIHYLQ